MENLQYLSEVWTQFLIQCFVLIFITLHIHTEDIKTMKEHVWSYIVNTKMLIVICHLT